MRFPRETRAAIHEADPHPVTIPWPAGERQPQSGRIYWLQSAEDLEEADRKERARREYSPETCAEVLAGMARRAGLAVEAPPRRHRHAVAHRPREGDPRILVIDTTIQERGWQAKVALYADPDPVHHTGIKARVPAGPNPITGIAEPAEFEPERLDEPSTHDRRREEEAAMKLAHKASVDYAEIIRAERKLLDQRRRGRRSRLKEEALGRAKKRVAELSAGEAA